MIRRDYIMKLIQQLLDSLFLLLNEKDIDDSLRLEKLEKFYKEYLGTTKDFYHTSSLDEILDYFAKEYGGEEVLYRVEMLSEVLYNESFLQVDEIEKQKLLQKTFEVLTYLENNSNTYSVVRKGKLDAVREELN